MNRRDGGRQMTGRSEEEPTAAEEEGRPKGGNGRHRPRQGPAPEVIARFGGIRPMAAKLGIAVTTVQGWKERGVIPEARHEQVLAAAREHDIALTEEEISRAVAASPLPPPVTAAPSERGEEPEPFERPTPPPLPPPLPPESAARPRRGLSAALLVGLVVVVLLAGAGGYAWWQGWIGPGASPWQQIAELVTGPAPEAAPATVSEPAETPAAAPAPPPSGKTVAAAAPEAAEPAEAPAAPAAIEPSASEAAAEPEEEAAAEPEAEGAPGTEAAAEPEAAPEVAAEPAPQAHTEAAPEPPAVAVAAVPEAELESLRAETARLAGELDEARGRIAALERSLAVGAGAAAGSSETAGGALLLATGQLREALRGPGPFAAELEAVRAVAGDDPGIAAALAPLAPLAAGGVPTVEMLRARFDGAAIVRAGRLPAEPSWLDRALYEVASLVTVRRTGMEVGGASPEALAARAEAWLAAGDLAAALETLSGLEGPAAVAAEPWLAQARPRLAADRALADLQRLAIAGLAGPPAAARDGDG